MSFIPAAYSELTSIEFCWKSHDECDGMNSNETKLGLTNTHERRYWHCHCDLEFYNCLHRLNSTVSNHIGELHFNFYTRCYRVDYQIEKCQEHDKPSSSNTERRCVKYLLRLKTKRRNQWFDLPYYSGKPMQQSILTID